MDKITRLKGWQIILGFLLIPFLIFLNSPFIFNIGFHTFVIVTTIAIIWICLILFWFYSVNKILTADFLSNVEFLLLRIAITIILILLLITIPIGLLSFYSDYPKFDDLFYSLSKSEGLISVLYYSSALMIIVITARSLARNEVDRVIKFNDYYKYALGLILLPIGMYLVQEKIHNSKNQVFQIKLLNYILIITSLILVSLTFYVFNKNDFKFSIGSQFENSEFEIPQDIKDRIQLDFENMNDSSRIEFLLNNAIQLYNLGHYRNAINTLNIGIEMDSTYSDFFYNRGVILFEKYNQLDSAILDMTKTIYLDSSDWRAFYNRGYYLSIQEKFEKALIDIDYAKVIYPEFSNIYLVRGRILKNLGEIEAACKEWNIADSLGNSDVLIHLMTECD